MENKIELFAIVELFGHQRIAGVVTEQTIGGASFIRVDVPEIPEQPAYTRLLNPSAIYAINPVTEEVMRGSAQSIKSKPIQPWDAREMLHRIDALKLEAPKGGWTSEELDDLFKSEN
jgi:hypothetical protein